MNETITLEKKVSVVNTVFDEKHVLHELKHYLPTQTPLKDFIHHNSLHAFQSMKFYDAIFKASKIFGFKVTLQLDDFRKMHENGRIKKDVLDKIVNDKKGADQFLNWKEKLLTKEYNESIFPRVGTLRAYWKTKYKIDLDSMVQPLLFRVLCSYLDQGISVWDFPQENKGFLNAIKDLEKNSFSSFFKTKRAKKLLEDGFGIKELLKIIVGNEAYYEQYLFDQQFSHRGWSGMVSAIEDQPGVLLDKRVISLNDLIVFDLLLEIDALDKQFGNSWEPLCTNISTPPVDLFVDAPLTELDEVFKLWQDAFEWSYYDEVLAGIALEKKKQISAPAKTSFQAMFCIDERECSIRRNIEHVDPNCETLAAPGFFGVEFYFKPQNAKFYDKLCPAPVFPKYLIKEINAKGERKHELLYTKKNHTFFIGSVITMFFGFISAVKLFLTVFRPKMSPAISNAFIHMDKTATLSIENKDVNDRENDLQIGFTIDEMAARVEGLLRGIGMVKNFAPIVYVIGHGSSSANNPHHGAHDCGACSGRPGSVNSRVFAFMTNHPKVRAILNSHGLVIPDATQFVGGLHDTAADEIEFYDEALLNSVNAEAHKKNKIAFENALDLNAKERSRRFASINTKGSLKQTRKAIKDRSVSLFEPRPELGHGTNTLCIIGRREFTKGLFLDRRAFMNSYDYRTDKDATLLTGVMRPIGLVCGGINLEYYFSRVDNHKLGAGTKLPHNVMGLIGVANSADGDLRPGLPLQMIEVHDPVRLLVIVEHYPEAVMKAITITPEIYEWYKNEWVHIVALHPETNKFYYFKNGEFTEYTPLTKELGTIKDMKSFVEAAKEMETNHIVDATKENLPVYSLEN